jgi:glycosyltransferase involved in cell wall biosynthesis
MAASLVRSLAARGIECHVGTLRSGPHSNVEILDAVRDCGTQGVAIECRGRFDRAVPMRIRDYALSSGIDIIHSHKYKTNLYARLAARGTQLRLMATCHNWVNSRPSLYAYAVLDKVVLRGFDVVVGVSQSVVDQLGRAGGRHLACIPNGIDLARFTSDLSREMARARLGLPPGPIVGFVGRLSRLKDVSTLLRAFASLATTAPAVLVIVGGGEEREALESEARALEIAGRTHFLGERDDTTSAYRAFDVLVLPSLVEASPLVVLEAMAAGTPVIATRVGAIPDVLDNGRCGHIVPTGNASVLAERMAEVLADPAAQQRIRSAAAARVAEHYSLDAMTDQYVELYRNLARTQRAAWVGEQGLGG